MNEEQLASFLASAKPYHFTIHNECNDLASASINLESLTVSGKSLEDEYIDAILYEDDYNSNLNTNKQLTGNTSNDENKVISDAKHAYSLYNFTLKANEERDFNLLLYMNPDTPMVDTNMNASWKGKITLSTEYQEENTTIRQIFSSDTNGMWEHKDKLTKIVIENKKSVKTAEDGGKVYGPFDESADGYGGVQSYVVCDNEETDCTGYLQGTNGIKGNEDCSNLFKGFSNVTNIEGLENIDTRNVTNMSSMFNAMTNLQEIDLSMWDTSNVVNIDNLLPSSANFKKINLQNLDLSKVESYNMWMLVLYPDVILDMSNSILPKNCSNFFSTGPGFKGKSIILKNVDTSQVTNMQGMFTGAEKIQELDVSSFDTSNVINMSGMFNSASNIQELDVSSFDTRNVTNMAYMFFNMQNIQKLDLSSFDISNVTNFQDIFKDMTDLQKLNISNWDLSKIEAGSILNGLSNLNTLDMTNFVFPKDCSGFFAGLSGLNNLILNDVDTSNVTNMTGMFHSASSIQELDLSSFDTSQVTSMTVMFGGTTNLQSITFGPKFVHKADASTTAMFNGCRS